ncbi:helix-turn-helix transcriptional regulator [Streptomyces spectabilis]|uniref:Transcriptional regulator with XRE-family HTH domain n=1 Tax=Streptomyces spectabilis TaxID=68270 RepID=A0A5P2X1K0_STRST|nr:helix-turn-helix transcriptional regulator [Streptomyces spectabilis]MBB5101545.1 transcriptional regulator with XRE-family HTH domain [Streptomyces spectabilis]MCI3900730.1 helix-turn-helix transcriptional regulator [Streptomyces spectabilis]QEV58268.1 XRE family transcriptional regulator [Streptomyces spectabilis]GGV12057.1 transcriptional regulator [Streptomyces spectabilis]
MNSALAPRRTELASFLRSRRERLTPAAVGMAPGLRRRTPGLRREEVAHLAGVSITWYTWLEQGRPINVGAQILAAIATTLRLNAAERAHLFRLAEVPIPAVATTADPITPTLQTILDAITDFPAAAINSRWDMLGWNTAAAALWPRLTAPEGSRNVLWEMFTTPECCRCFVNRDIGLPHMVASFRADFARHLDDPAWTELIRSLATISPEFSRLWAAHDVAAPPTQTMTYRHPAVGDLSLSLTRMELPAVAETIVTVWTPADEDSHRRMAQLLAHPATPSLDHTH